MQSCSCFVHMGMGQYTFRYIFSGMNIHLPAILWFTRYQGFDPCPYIHFVLAVCRIHSPKKLSCLLKIHVYTIFSVSQNSKNIYAKKNNSALLVQFAPFLVQSAL